MFRVTARIACLVVAIALPLLAQNSAADRHMNDPHSSDPRLKNAFREPAKSGWTFVHLEGQPSEIGFQHGYLLAPEIEAVLKVTELEQSHDNNKAWHFFRAAAPPW